MAKKYKFFWGGYFSNWALSPFTVDGIEFICGEQYMMYKKAMLFKDKATAKKILETRNPRIQKELGRQVKNFSNKEWDKVKYEIVKEGLRAKFTQNPEFKAALLELRGYTFVEASPEDRIWGIGFSEANALTNIEKWGQNLLGNILTELSNEIV